MLFKIKVKQIKKSMKYMKYIKVDNVLTLLHFHYLHFVQLILAHPVLLQFPFFLTTFLMHFPPKNGRQDNFSPRHCKVYLVAT